MFLFLGALLAFAGVLGFAPMMLFSDNVHQHPSDDELLKRFREKRADLERLVQMFKADKGLGRVGPDFTRPEDPARVNVSPERIRQYRRLCDRVGATACIEGYDAAYERLYGDVQPGTTEVKNHIWIILSASGLSISGDSKGFLYSAAPPPRFEIVPDTDHAGHSTQRSPTFIRHIEGPWYVVYEVTN